MAGPTVQIDAQRTQRGLVPAGGKRRREQADPVLAFWSATIYHAVQDAKRMRGGEPTNLALQSRWWLVYKPAEKNRVQWERSFPCACRWLELDADKTRARLLKEIDRAWADGMLAAALPRLHQRAALVLGWAQERFEGGKPTPVNGQYVLPWPVDAADPDYETLVGVEHGDPAGWERKLKAAA